MPYELADDADARYRVPASLAPVQLHVGGEPEARAVRGYGSDTWFTVGDGLREATAFTFSGLLATDRDYPAIDTLLQDLEAALATAERLYEVDDSGADVAYLELRGALPVQASPNGIDGTLLSVQVHLLPAADDWRDA